MPLETAFVSSVSETPAVLGRDPIPIRSTDARRVAWSADARFVAKLKRGDAEAGRRFVHDHHPPIFRYLLRLCGQRETAEDLTQETFLEAWRSLPTFEGRATLRVWLCCIARRQFLHWLKRRHPHASLEEVPEPQQPSAGGMEERAALREVLERLPLEQREMVVLHYLEGYTCEEIGAIVGIAAGTVKYRLFAARARLREAMSDEESGGMR